MLCSQKTFSVSGKCDYSVDRVSIDVQALSGEYVLNKPHIHHRLEIYSLNLPCNLSRVRVYRSLFAAANLLCTFSSCFSLALSCIDPPWGRFRTVLNPADVCQLWGKCQTATSENRSFLVSSFPWSFSILESALVSERTHEGPFLTLQHTNCSYISHIVSVILNSMCPAS